MVEDPNIGDLLYWRGSNFGQFSINHALTLFRNEDEAANDPKWDLAWKAPVQQRVKVLLWLVLHDKLLCNANRLKRKLTEDPSCQRCSHNEETLLHLLRECPSSKHIWKSIGGSANYPSFFTGNLSEWICKNIKADGLIYSNKWPTCFATTLWWIWKWRNCVVFGRGNEIPIDTGTFLRNKVEEIWAAMNTSRDGRASGVGRMRRQVFIQWKAPLPNCLVLNTDGASKGTPGRAGGGGIIRDCSGTFQRAFSANFGICTAFRAELKAVSLGMDMAKEMGINKLEIQMDNEACVQVLQSTDYN